MKAVNISAKNISLFADEMIYYMQIFKNLLLILRWLSFVIKNITKLDFSAMTV